MEDLYGRPGLGDDHKMHLAFGLGKAYEDLEQYGKAFEFFLEGNRLKRKTFSYDVSREEGKLCRLREAFRATFVRGLGAAGNRSKVPIFVLGMPRSGTSLVKQILSSHADVFGAGELTLVEDTCAGHEGAGDKPWPERVCDFKDEDFHRCGSEYLSALRKQSPPARHIIDMMPGNFERTGFIRLMLPSARIIHVRRHPLDTCFSIFANYFAAHHPYAYDLRELGTYYRSYYEASMAHWRRVLPNAMFELSYEDLVASPEAEIRRLLDHCGLPFDAACLDFHKTKRAVQTNSAIQVRQPIYDSSVGRWRHFEEELEPLRIALGL